MTINQTPCQPGPDRARELEELRLGSVLCRLLDKYVEEGAAEHERFMAQEQLRQLYLRLEADDRAQRRGA